MNLVLDTNIVISAVLVKSDLPRIIFDKRINLFSPDYFLAEIEKYHGEITSRSKYTEGELNILLTEIIGQIEIVPIYTYCAMEIAAKHISPDEKDWPFVALSLQFGCPIWTHDGPLIKCKDVETITTKELIEKLQLTI